MNIDGVNYPGKRVVLVGLPRFLAEPRPKTPTFLTKCEMCEVIVRLDTKSIPIIMEGANVACIGCAIANYPLMVVGRDRDTGDVVTLAEWAERRANIKVNRYDDVRPDEARKWGGE